MKKIKGTTQSGFNFEILENVLEDYEILELFSESETNPLVITKIITRLFGEEQKNRLLEHCRGEDGIVKVSSIEKEFSDILGNVDIKK